MTIQTEIKETTYFIGQYVKSVNDYSFGYIVEAKPENNNVSIMNFDGGPFKQINFKLMIVWNDKTIQRNASEHDIEVMNEKDISESEALTLLIEAEQSQLKINNAAEIKKNEERDQHNKEVEALLNSTDYKHLTPLKDAPQSRGGKFAATNIRKQLKKHFPGVKFSVKSDYSSVNVRWKDGPTHKAVDEKINFFSDGQFDPYSDYHYRTSSAFNDAFGGVQFLFIDRDLSDELIQRGIDKAVIGWSDCEHVTLENYKNGTLHRQNDSQNAPYQWSKKISEQIDKIDLTPVTPTPKVKAPKIKKGAGVRSSIEEHTHTKKGFQMFIVCIADRVERDEYLSMLADAKVLGGWYSRKWGTTPAGFAFKSWDTASQFMVSIFNNPPKSPNEPTPPNAPKPQIADKLREMADKLQGDIDNKLNPDRLTNTPKRQREANSARHEGERLQRTQAAMRGLANHHDAGTVPTELKEIKTKKTIYDLMRSKISSGTSYYDAGVDSGEPYDTSPAALALWAMVGTKSEEEKNAEALRKKVENLNFANIPGYFSTPRATGIKMMHQLDIQEGDKVLEPQAGSGGLAGLVREFHPDNDLDTFETQHSLREILKLKGYNLRGDDFLKTDIWEEYDKIVMNPPFEKLQDINHVLHAYNALKVGGRLVAIMSPSPFFNSCSKAEAFRQWFKKYNGYKADLPTDSFKESGTSVNTVLIVIDK